jgi:hypothetical protein
MTRDDFLENVRKALIRPDAFALNGPRDECHVLSGDANNWSVYYSERGLETGKRHFDSQSEALEYLLETLKSDPSATREG